MNWHTGDRVRALVSLAETYPGFQVDNRRSGNWRTENKVTSPWQHPSIPRCKGRRRRRRRRRAQGNVS